TASSERGRGGRLLLEPIERQPPGKSKSCGLLAAQGLGFVNGRWVGSLADARLSVNRAIWHTRARMSWNLPTVERASTLEQVHRTLREAIVQGSIAQGTHLREISLAEALGTSRATVREAIRQLVQEGLVEYA